MATTLDDINNLINDRRRDTTSNSINMTTVGFRAINSTLNIWNQIHDWPWTIKESDFDYNAGITEYTLPTDMKYPLTLKEAKPPKTSEYTLLSPLKFDSDATHPKKFAISVVARTQTLRVKSNEGETASINTATSYNGNGTWVGASAISNVSTDSYEYNTLKGGSVKFDYSGTSGTITNSTQSAVDLTSFKERGTNYFEFYFPTVTNFTSITIKMGSDASNYWTNTITTDYLGNTPVTGWNTLSFNWSTSVGSPDASAIDYIQLTVAYGSSTTATAFRFQNFFASVNVPMTLTYYSTNMVYDTSGSTQLQIFNDSSATTDYPLWSGRWDAVTETFINTVLETIFWITGEYTDKAEAEKRIVDLTASLRSRYPSQRRYPTVSISQDINL